MNVTKLHSVIKQNSYIGQIAAASCNLATILQFFLQSQENKVKHIPPMKSSYLSKIIVFSIVKLKLKFNCLKLRKFQKGEQIWPYNPPSCHQHLNSCCLLWRQNIAGCCQQTFEYKKFVNNAQQCFPFTPQANFHAHNLNFHWRWRSWDWIQATF